MPDLPEAMTAALADRYTLERELGHGAMATVYLARDQKLDRLVALKVLTPELALGVRTERFLREIQVTSRGPLDPLAPAMNVIVGNAFLRARRYDEA